MFVGHYAAAFAAKAAEPKAPLWALVAGAQLIDIAWGVLIISGAEHGRIDPSLPGNSLVLEHMPYTHSLPAVIAWAALAALFSKYVLRLSGRVALVIAAVVASHWFLDLLVHRPDLELFPNGPKVGLALWNLAVPEQAVEIGLLAITGVFWSAQRVRSGDAAWPAAAFIALLLAIQIVSVLLPQQAADSIAETGPIALGVFVLASIVAAFTDGRRANSPQPRP
jgi:membrane-bound metal-dependent hydrolase YbcI (DUF457 family)